jgi:sugar lactone lactonase YvrE
LTLVEQPTSTTAPAAVDQTPPSSANGVLVLDDVLWIASLEGGEILAVDAESGTILRRVGAEAGVAGPDDLAVGPDGRIWWTGFQTGVVGAFDPETGVGEVIAEVGEGANPIAFGDDGRLFVARALTGAGFYELDPAGGSDPTLLIEDPGAINGFAVAEDGRVWAPRTGPATTGGIVAIDPDARVVEDLVTGIAGAIALDIGPDGRAYVAAVNPARVEVWDPDTGEVTRFAEPATALLDNLAFGADGVLYVTGFDEPIVSVIQPDGTVTTLTVGEA